jgi:hypothetical protein
MHKFLSAPIDPLVPVMMQPNIAVRCRRAGRPRPSRNVTGWVPMVKQKSTGDKWDSNRMIAAWHPFLYRSAYLNVGAPEC